MIPIDNTSGFYKLDKQLVHSIHVKTAEYELLRDKAHCYVYPVDGWIFFYSRAEAEAYFTRRSK